MTGRFFSCWLLALAAVACTSAPRATPAGDVTGSADPAPPEGSQPGDFAHLRAEGVDFLASGNEPFWAVKIDFDGTMRFSSLDGADSLTMPVPVPESADDTGEITYRAETESGQLEMVIRPVACTDNMSGARAPYTVRVRTQGRTYEGCGRSLTDADALRDVWTLTALRGQPADTAAYTRGVPTLELHPLAQRATGHGGCNRFMGRVVLSDTTVQFGPLASTMMACPGTGEDVFMAALERTNHYRREGNELVLLTDAEETLRFRKVD